MVPADLNGRVALTPGGCQIGYMDSILAVIDENVYTENVNFYFKILRRKVPNPGCQIGFMDYTGCRRLNRVLTHNNDVVKSVNPAQRSDAQDGVRRRRRRPRGRIRGRGLSLAYNRPRV